jgi:hypothetical protein
MSVCGQFKARVEGIEGFLFLGANGYFCNQLANLGFLCTAKQGRRRVTAKTPLAILPNPDIDVRARLRRFGWGMFAL